MHAMVALLRQWEQESGQPLGFVLQVGDFEPHRHEDDLATMAAPSKYRQLGDFADYHSGRSAMPWPVYFIGGNHEPYGLLDQHPDGAEIAPNVRYLGRAGSVSIHGLTVAGLSGIYREDYFERHRPSVADIDSRSNKDYIYFTASEVDKVLECGSADILLLHEWPAGIVAPEDEEDFENQRRSMRYDQVGNDYARMVMDLLEPQLVLCGHMHKRYRRALESSPEHTINVACMAHVMQKQASIAVFEIADTSEHRAGEHRARRIVEHSVTELAAGA